MAALIMCRLRALCTSSASVLSSRGLKVTGHPFASFPWDEPTAEADFESEEDLREIKSKQKKQQKTILFQRMKRQMEPRGPPERQLTWNAIEQIRYLKQESPEEWTVARLAEGFNVRTDVIRRVLRSTFSPPEKRKVKQDVKALKPLGQVPQGSTVNVLQPGFCDKDPTHQLLTSGKEVKQLGRTQTPYLISPPQTMHHTENPNALVLKAENAVTRTKKANLQTFSQQSKPQKPISIHQSKISDEYSDAEQMSSIEDDQTWLHGEWDGDVLSNGELEELAERATENRMKVVQKGREFFDTNGNFLYRI
ncbi:neugrin [Rhinophrynus dorsalis]